MSLSRLETAQVQDKRVLVRIDLETATDSGGNLVDDLVLKQCQPTIELLVNRGAAVVVAGHGPFSSFDDLKKNPQGASNYQAFARRLGELLDRNVDYVGDPFGPEGTTRIRSLTSGEIVFTGNMFQYAGEIKKDKSFAQNLASLFDILVNDSLAASRLPLASLSLLPALLPTFGGMSINRELDILKSLVAPANRPLVFIMGGVRLAPRIQLMNKLMEKLDTVLIGGGIAYTFLNSRAVPVGNSLREKELEVPAFQCMEKADLSETEFVLPVDHVIADQFSKNARTKTVAHGGILDQWMALDIGPKTIGRMEKTIKKAHTVLWYGPLGAIEMDKFGRGSQAIARAMAKSKGRSIVLGSDTTRFVNQEGLAESFDLVSTCSSAALDILSGKTLPGLSGGTEDS